MIPEFADNGNLPPGIHTATWSEFVERFGSNLHRNKLIYGLRNAIDSLKIAGCKTVFIDGSFVTRKETPGDFDALWNSEGVDIQLLIFAEPVLFETANHRAAQKAKFGGELFPISQLDQTYELWLNFFQQDRDGTPKGLILLDIGTLE